MLVDVDLAKLDDAYMFGKFDEKLSVMNFNSVKFLGKRSSRSYGLSGQEKDYFSKDKEGYFVPHGLVVNGSSRSRQFMAAWGSKSFIAGVVGQTCVHRHVK